MKKFEAADVLVLDINKTANGKFALHEEGAERDYSNPISGIYNAIAEAVTGSETYTRGWKSDKNDIQDDDDVVNEISGK